MRYSYPQIYLQEIPGEITLGISISGCPLHCKGCHSTETWPLDFGNEMDTTVLEQLFKKHKHISCFLIYDGLHDNNGFMELFNLAKAYNLKTALYTGLEMSDLSVELIAMCDYIKVGPYIAERGNLSEPSTNQKLFYNGIDITYQLQQKIK